MNQEHTVASNLCWEIRLALLIAAEERIADLVPDYCATEAEALLFQGWCRSRVTEAVRAVAERDQP